MRLLTNEMVECYLQDCLGYDEVALDEIKENFEQLKDCLSDNELSDCIYYTFNV